MAAAIKGTQTTCDYVPTKAEIRRQCKAFQAGWTAETRRTRWQYPATDGWTIPMVGRAFDEAIRERMGA